MWYNPLIKWLLRSPLHFTVSKSMMTMTYKGRKSGKIYTTPMSYLEIGNALYTISSRERLWWRNLRGGTEVSLRLRGKDKAARSETLENPTEVASSLSQYFTSAPQLAKYMDVRINNDNLPNPQDISRLAQENVIVRTDLK